ncbi:hypothetical protein BDV26DRAFT_173028 [Aspergillus bertholletiae]|uniref:Mid2 domain-containing protein n=1 Tax=Aspergillus bertholletiae TaxID=1226010 RepID=A0A5N7BBQ2_9EURO|nr:hypothetical protein BDV26DRAFT_173028 [Aspergillus bertholletiae]
MKSLRILSTLLLTLSMTPTATQAWTFTWRNASNTPFVDRSSSPAPCTPIEQAAGKEFVFEPNNSPYSFYIWSNDNCSGPYSGFTPPSRWDKKASTNLRSYLVNYGGNDGPSTATSTSSSSSSTSTSTTSASTASSSSTESATETATGAGTATASASATSSPGGSSGSSSGISSGAVAGIVVGVVGAVIVAGGAFWLGRRRRGQSGGTGAGSGFGSASGPGAGYVQPGTPIGGSNVPGGYMGADDKGSLPYMYENHPMSPVPAYQPPVGTQYAELPGESVRVEMSDTSRVSELEGSGKR